MASTRRRQPIHLGLSHLQSSHYLSKTRQNWYLAIGISSVHMSQHMPCTVLEAAKHQTNNNCKVCVCVCVCVCVLCAINFRSEQTHGTNNECRGAHDTLSYRNSIARSRQHIKPNSFVANQAPTHPPTMHSITASGEDPHNLQLGLCHRNVLSINQSIDRSIDCEPANLHNSKFFNQSINR